MASSLFALLDDIASVLDDVAVLTKVATKKTAGVLGDDLALNAQQVTGVAANREWPVVWAVAKGSLVNKAILVPLALAISIGLPWALLPLLMVGGAFLCFEGVEKVLHPLLHRKEAEEEARTLHEALMDEKVDLVQFEKDKIKGAIRTDFILSAEIIVIALGTVATAPLLTRVSVLVSLSLLMTVGVYGLVALIVKMDDAGLLLQTKQSAFLQLLGRSLLKWAPQLMKALSVLGVLAMFLVGGGIVVHAIPPLHHFNEGLEKYVVASPLFTAAVGFIVGAIVVGIVTLWKKLRH